MQYVDYNQISSLRWVFTLLSEELPQNACCQATRVCVGNPRISFPASGHSRIKALLSTMAKGTTSHNFAYSKFHYFVLQKKEGQNELSLKKSREMRDPPDNCIQARNTNVYVAHQARHCCPTLVETCAKQVNQLETNL